MSEFVALYYPWIKAFHVISIITWMAGLLYMPRIYVYHVEGLSRQGVTKGSDLDLMFQYQEKRLLRAIMNPAMIMSWLLGGLLAGVPGYVDWSTAWPWVKAVAVILLSAYHMFLSRARKNFVKGTNTLTGRQWRYLNEVPTVLMILTIIAVVVKF